MDVWERVNDAVVRKERINVSLLKKNIYVANKPIMKNGVLTDGYTTKAKSWGEIEEIYESFKRSVPDKKRRFELFKGVDLEELSVQERLFNMDRKDARHLLETALLVSKENLDFGDGNYFYQGADKDFVVLKKWMN